MRERRNLTFDMENPRHREALAHFDAQPNKLKSEYVIDAILGIETGASLADAVRLAVSEALAGASFSPAGKAPAEAAQATERISDLPDALISAMDDSI